MRRLVVSTLVCAAALVAGFVVRPSPEAASGGQPGEPAAPRRKAETLTELLAREARGSHAGRWEMLLSLADDPPDPDAWPALLEEVRTDPFAAEAVVRAWMRDDPESCWAHLLTLGEGGLPPEALGRAAAEVWGSTNPETAMAALTRLPVPARATRENLLRDDLRWIALREAFALDPARAFALVPSVSDAYSFRSGTFEHTFDGDPASATRILAAMPDTYFRWTIAHAARTWFREDPEAALEWALDAPPGVQRKAFEQIADEWMEAGDIASLRALAETTTSMALRADVANDLLPVWIKDDPEAAFDWMGENLDGFVAHSVAKNATSALMRESREVAKVPDLVPFAERLPPGPTRGGAASELITNWVRDDPGSALAWADSLDPASRSFAYKDLAGNWSHHPWAAEWLKSAPDHRFADTLLHSVIQNGDTPALEALANDLPPAQARRVKEALANRPEARE